MSLQHLLDQGRQTVLEALDQALALIEQGTATNQHNINDGQDPLQSESTIRQPESHKKILSNPSTLQALSAKQQLHSSDATSDAKNVFSSSEDFDLLKINYSLLQRKFDALSSNFKLAKDALQKRKDERDGWVQHAGRLENLIREAEKKHHIRILSGSIRAAEAQANVVDAEPVKVKSEPQLPPLPPHASPTSANKTIPASLETLDSTQSDSNDGTGPQISARDLSANITAADSESSSSIPVVVSERIVKKRRCREEQTPIKKEVLNSSSPVLSSFKFKPDTQGSLDLGEIGQKIVTPRRRRQITSPPPVTDNSASDMASPKAAPIVSPAKGAKRPRPATILQQPTVLTPVSVNVRQIKPRHNRSNQRPVKPGLEYAIGALAEDGNNHKAAPTTREQYKDKSGFPESRIDILLDSPLSIIDGYNERIQPYSRTVTTNNALIPNRRSLPFVTDEGEKATTFPKQTVTPSRLEITRPRPAVSHERLDKAKDNSSTTFLRRKPLSELQLDDFKVNPSINDGHAFAFTEVVRDKSERACLPGCTDLSCCGKQFRALAISQRPDPPLTPAQRMEEQKLLEEYMGDEAFRLASMTSEERLEVWIEAKAQELANKFGKHKHRFSRMQSPPGFWNPDFPTTQELKEEHAEAFKRQRQAVATRYREAMRTDGKWVFRDE